jgi:hypothetical protein
VNSSGLDPEEPAVQSHPVALDKPPSLQPHAEAARNALREREDRGVFAVCLDESLLPPFVSPRALALCSTAGLVVFALASWVGVGVHLAHLRQVYLLFGGASLAALSLSQVDYMIWIVKWTQLVAFGATALALIGWLYRLRVNLRALGVRKPAFARYWSVLGFLIPAVNFVIPYQVMAEVWRASDPSVLDRFEWKRVEPPRILMLWWGSVVIAATLELAAFGLGETAGVTAFKSLLASAVAVLASAASGLSASLGCFVVARLTAAQIAKYQLLCDDDVGA